jgi:pimeloyl-ACP methyl ester carboxylesterase
VKVPTTSYLQPLFVMLLAAFSSPVPASEPTYWAGLNGGPYTVGFSMGAAAGIVAAMRRSDIKTVISLDGLEGMPDGPNVIRPATGFEPARFNADFLRFGRAVPAQARSVIEELTRSDRYLLEIPDAAHLDFIPSSAFAAAAGESVTEDSLAIYQAASLALLAFLDRSLASAGSDQELGDDPPLLAPTDTGIADALHTALNDPRIKSLRSRVCYKHLTQK